MWKEKLEEFLGGPRLARMEQSLGRDAAQYVFDSTNISRIPDFDIAWFFRAIEAGYLSELPNGDFIARQDGGVERVYWHLNKSDPQGPGRVTAAVEAIIAIGAVARMVEQFGWEADRIGLQFKWGRHWPFDLTIREADGGIGIQCEVKTRAAEVDSLCQYLQNILNGAPPVAKLPAKTKSNFEPKAMCLIETPPKVFWALGPDGYEKVFRVARTEETNRPLLIAAENNALHRLHVEGS